jgi:hypothetical protein
VSFGLSPALGNQNHIVLGMLAKAAGIDPRQLNTKTAAKRASI